MINIAVKYMTPKNEEGVLMGGFNGGYTPIGKDYLLEYTSLYRLSGFPVIFSPAGVGTDTAVISDFAYRIEKFLYTKYRPDKFSVSKFIDDFTEFYRELSKIHRSYYTEEEFEERESKFDFDFIFAGSDFEGRSFLYYGRVREFVTLADIKFAPGYVITLLGSSEGMAFLKEILTERFVDHDIALFAIIAVMELLKRVKNLQLSYSVIKLEKGGVFELKDDILTRIGGRVDYKWNVLWKSLRNSLTYPDYIKYVIQKLIEGGKK